MSPLPLLALLRPLLPPDSQIRDPDAGLEGLAGQRLLFALALDESGCSESGYRMLMTLRRSRALLEGCVAGLVVTGRGELYTKDAARDLVFAANQAGCAFLGRPLVEATGSLRNFRVQAQIGGTDEETAFRAAVSELLERLEVGLLVLPDVEEEDPLRREITALAEEKGIETLFLAEDADVTFGESALRIYAPLGSGGANEEGLSVLCTAGDFDGLITGDMNDTVEKRLIKYGSLPDLELLVAGHHGSKYATSEELLLATTPELAVISVGYNTYGHPAPETLERLAAAGCAIYRTDWSGTVTITAK